MQVFRFHRNQLKRFDDQHLNLVYDQEVYAPYINRVFSIEHFDAQMDQKQLSQVQRSVLMESLLLQYAGFDKMDAVNKNILALGENETYTVTTGHQLALLTGPLYFVVKILHVIKLCERLRVQYPDKKFVPLFWMASEDHDFAEIQSVEVFGKTFTWESDQKGPVGRFKTNGFEEFKAGISELFGNHPESEIHALLEKYKGATLAEASRNLIHELFNHYGLVVLDGDDPKLKSLYSTVIEKELKEGFSYTAIQATNESLKRDGGKIQVNPREINLFYIKDGFRERIERKGDGFYVEGVGEIPEPQLLDELKAHPERFSPNVVLRPLYQETILPNLAYIGGVGEMSYWLQIKGVFDAMKCVYPMIAIRNSVMWIDKNVSKKMAKIEMHIEEAFSDTDLLKKEFVLNNAGEQLNFESLDKSAEELYRLIGEMITNIDTDRRSYAEAEISKLQKQLEGIKEKMIKHSKAKHDETMKLIDFIKGKLFPGGGLQERSANFFSFCPDGNYSENLKLLYDALDPEESDFMVIREF